MSKRIDVEKELDLQLIKGVGPATKDKLVSVGITNMLDLVTRTPHEISNLLGIDIERANTLFEEARKKLAELGLVKEDFVSALDMLERRKKVEYITTGSANLDNLLGGGIETGAVTEFYGEFGTGKTQLCHTLCVNVQLPKSEGGLESPAIYIDTEGTFRPERIQEIATARGLDPKKVLSNVYVARAYNTFQLFNHVNKLSTLVFERGVRLVCVDSLVSHFRAEYIGREALAERQQRLNTLMHKLLTVAELHNTAIVVTNQVQAAPDVFFGDPTRPIGGHVVAHAITYRIYLRKGHKDRKIARMVDSPHHPPGETVFIITEGGIADPS